MRAGTLQAAALQRRLMRMQQPVNSPSKEGLERSISVNLGLPFVRTSVDHGTAFDIAGGGVANATSMIEAIKTAVSLTSGQGLPGEAMS